MYEVVNEELKIKACNLGDLTVEQVSYFLKQWEEGAAIGTLTMFYDRNGYLVLNKDNKGYHSHLEITEEYLTAADEEREQLRNNCPKSMQETMNVMESFIKYSRVTTETHHALKNRIQSSKNRDVLRYIDKIYTDCAAYIAFKYGVMEGKRIERRKKRQSASA